MIGAIQLTGTERIDGGDSISPLARVSSWDFLRLGHCGRPSACTGIGADTATHARYLCKGDYDDGGTFIASARRQLGNRTRCVGQELFKGDRAMGVEASLRGIEDECRAHAQRAARPASSTVGCMSGGGRPSNSMTRWIVMPGIDLQTAVGTAVCGKES